MKKALLWFWQYVSSNFAEEIEEYLDMYGFTQKDMSDDSLKKMDEGELVNRFRDVINLFMDVSGIDNYGDVYDLLKSNTSLSEEQLTIILS